MGGTGWDRRFSESTRGRVVALLRRGNQTVEDLARALHLTDNAVRSHLATLERDGLIRQQGVRRGIGKPAYGYELTPDAERLFPKPYAPVLRHVLDVLADRLGPAELEDVLRVVGRRLAAGSPPPPADRRAGAHAAVAALNELGGLAEFDEHDGVIGIRGYSCPLAAAVPGHPQVCSLAESLLTELVGYPVRACCDRGEPPRCRFELAMPAGP